MSKSVQAILKTLRGVHAKVFGTPIIDVDKYMLNDHDKAANIIYDFLTDDKPRMIARFGANELSCLVNYRGVVENDRNMLRYIRGKSIEWWWNENIIQLMHTGAGFFPPEVDKIEKFCKLMMDDISYIDALGSWLPSEKKFDEELKHVLKLNLLTLDPYWAAKPWTRALEGKKVLVVHPFAKTIENQYSKRKNLFDNNLLPDFELKTIKAVQSIAGNETPFRDWFEALDFMKDQIDRIDCDICLIGAGAYGFPLAAHVKRSGKKGFHIGGSLQLLFGIRGKRWEENYHHVYKYESLVNEYWVRPGEDEKPANAELVENACYW
ncbi:hypothetical protein [Maribellus maritimus]|uniref:hypothetical protein n=1 Tax=Maribellus maritimus TaxID=2870838 RepID=UPI001EEA3757|nr:hypothetical protein [Maribellus maritimus]MCG6190240.1 hypothetical protein [Maribellus maritimus]